MTALTNYLLEESKAINNCISRLDPLQVDEQITPNADNVGIGLPFEQNKLTTAFSPTNFIFTNSYGIAPSNTTLTVRYLKGGGTGANIAAGQLNQISPSSISFVTSQIGDSSIAQYIFDSVAVSNPFAADCSAASTSFEVALDACPKISSLAGFITS